MRRSQESCNSRVVHRDPSKRATRRLRWTLRHRQGHSSGRAWRRGPPRVVPGRLAIGALAVAVLLAGIGIALWVGWQPVSGSAGISFTDVQAREAPAALGKTRSPISFSNVQAREALAGMGGTPAPITNTDVQAREALAGMGGTPSPITNTDVQAREALAGTGRTRHRSPTRRPGARGGPGRLTPAPITPHARPGREAP